MALQKVKRACIGNNYEEKEMIPQIDEETKSYEELKVCYICKREFIADKNDKKAFKL